MEHEAAFESATGALKGDHRIIEKVLAVVERLAETTNEISVTNWEKALDFIKNFADKCHHLKEEKAFFPALVERGVPVEGGPIGMMLMEHEEARQHVRAMSSALLGAKENPHAKATLLEHAKAYLRLLHEHIIKEDEVLFPMADRLLTPDEQKDLLRHFEEHEALEIGAGVHDQYLEMARELEAYCG